MLLYRVSQKKYAKLSSRIQIERQTLPLHKYEQGCNLKIVDVERFIKNRYTHLLTVLVVFLLLVPVFEYKEPVLGLRLLTLALLLMIFLCLRVTIKSRRVFWLCVLIAGFSFFLGSIKGYVKTVEIERAIFATSTFINSFFVGWTIVLLMKGMFKAPKISINTIMGGVCVYLLIGILWALLYTLLNNLRSDIAVFEPGASLFYFSYTTLTTLGYGDIVPKARFVMMLANFEAISGQMFLAVFIARLVGLYTAQEMRLDKKDAN